MIALEILVVILGIIAVIFWTWAVVVPLVRAKKEYKKFIERRNKCPHAKHCVNSNIVCYFCSEHMTEE